MVLGAPSLEGPRNEEEKMNKNILLGSLGFLLILGGVILSFCFWPMLVDLVKGFVGPVLAILGFVLMSLTKR